MKINLASAALAVSLFISLPRARAAEIASGGYSPAGQDGLTASEPRPFSASDLGYEPGVFYGHTVTVRSEVDISYGKHAFLLSDEPLLAAPVVLVIMPKPLTAAAEGYMMTVTGIPQPFDPDVLARTFPWFSVRNFGGPRRVHSWKQDHVPVIIAGSAVTEGGLQLVQQPSAVEWTVAPRESNLVASANFWAPNTTEPVQGLRALFLGTDRSEWVGRKMDLGPVKVWMALRPDLITVGPDYQHQLLVQLPRPNLNMPVGAALSVSGVLHSLAEALPRWGLSEPLGPAQGLSVYLRANRAERLME